MLIDLASLRRFVDAANGITQRLVEFLLAHSVLKTFRECTRKAGNHPSLLGQQLVCLIS